MHKIVSGNTCEDYSSRDFFHLLGENEKVQLRLLSKLGFHPIEISDASPVVHCESYYSSKKLLLVKGVGVVFFGESPVFDEIYPISSELGQTSGFGIKVGSKYEMYTFNNDFIENPVVYKVDNGLTVEGVFESYEGLVAFVRFYYSGVLNSLEI